MKQKRYLVNGVPSNNPEGFKFCVTLPDGSEEVLYDPHPKQVEFHKRTEPNVLMYGGRGSGKSLALRMEAHMRALSTPNFFYCILRRTYPELQQSHLKFITNEMKKLGGEFNKTEKIAYYPNGSKGFFSHCAGDEDVTRLLSSEYAWMGFDEISTFEWEMFTMLSASLRVNEGSNLIAMSRAATNPFGPSAEQINRYFNEKDISFEEDPDYKAEDWHAIKANLEDNPSVDAEQYMRRLQSGLPEHVRKAWVDGEFTLENGLFDVYPQKKIEVDGVSKIIPYHFIDSLDIASVVRGAQIYRAMDMGWFPDPTYILWIAHLGNRLIAFHEKILYKTIAVDVAARIKEEDQRLGIRNSEGELTTRVVATYCDPTMNINTSVDVHTVKDVLEMQGIPLELSLNNREMFASAIHSALGQEAKPNVPRLQIYTKGCPYLAKSLPKMRYDKKNPLKLADHHDDHPAVTLAYFLISSGAMDRQSIQTQPLRPWMREKDPSLWVLGNDNVKK